MDYEKKYNALVGQIKKAYLNAQTYSTKAVLEDILPSLKESEDERIRKALIRFHKSTIDIDGIKGEDVIAWLEKQQVLSIEEDMEGRGDTLWCIEQAKKYAKDENEMGTCWFAEKWLEKQGEQKPVVITPKFRVGDEIKTSNEKSLTITKIDEKGYWSEDLFICDFDEECIWDLVGQKHAKWNEEDEEILQRLYTICNMAAISHSLADYTKEGYEEALEWLKSLKPQKQWKPTEEQIKVLEYYMHNLISSEHKEVLFGLYDQLKKLKGE